MAFRMMSTLASRSGTMLIAASVTMSGSLWRGTSMMKQWLIRRSVRIPPSCATTALISSSVWRLPFINASTRPAVTSPTALAAESWLCADATSSKGLISSPVSLAALRMRSGGPTRIGSMSPSLWASIAPLSETSSQGCATATLILVAFWAAAINRLCLSPPVGASVFGSSVIFGYLLQALVSFTPSAVSTRATLLFSSLTNGPGHEQRAQSVQRRVGLGLARMDELRQRLDRALLVEPDELELLLRHILEMRKGKPLIGLSRVANDFGHAEPAFVDRALRFAYVDQRAQHAFIRRSRLEPIFERQVKFGRSRLALKFPLDMARGCSRLRIEPDHGQDERRSVGIQEYRFG